MKLSMTPPRQCAMRNKYTRATFLSCSLAIALLMNTATAFASDCDLRLSDNEVDYGTLYRGELSDPARNGLIPLGKRQLRLTVNCQTPTQMAIRFSATPAEMGGFRFANKGKLQIALSNAQLDARSVLLADQDNLANAGPNAILAADRSVAAVAQGQIATGKTFSVQVDVDTYIDDAATKVGDNTTLDSYGTFTFSDAGQP